MRAVVCHQHELDVRCVPDPVPGPGQLVLDVVRSGICGSDLHARHSADDLADVLEEVGYADPMRADVPVVLGHEVCGRVAEVPGCSRVRGLEPGQLAVTFPLLRVGDDVRLTGLSGDAPGGLAEQVLVEAAMTLPVPDGLDPDLAVLTEPMAVALHAVNRGEVGRRDVAVVLGCGPVGLAVVLQLKARGVRTVVASDPSAARRALATRCGADVVVDPAAESPWDVLGRGHLTTAPALLELAVGSMEKLRRVPGWTHLYRAADRLGAADPRRPVVFECVGVPGMIDAVVAGAPLSTRVVVVGLCMGEDRLRPSMAVNKEVELRFVLGYTPLELHDALHQLARGVVDGSPLVTGTVGLDGVASAFDALAAPDTHAKILLDPTLPGPAIHPR